jgi:cytidylate kinase
MNHVTEHADKIITIDGPSGVGKGTLARWLAINLSYRMLDSGSVYRIGALAVLNAKVNLNDEQAVCHVLENMHIAFETSLDTSRVLLDNQDVTTTIREEKVGMSASVISSYKQVRQLLLQKQRDFASEKGLVADGRDMGTVVFPDARYKFFLDADAEVRARRRYDELIEKGHTVNYQAVYDDLAERDHKDRNREVAPLKPASDAIFIDTGDMSIQNLRNYVWHKLSKSK